MSGELQFIDWLRSQSAGSRGVVVPVGDDLAALRWNAANLLLIGADQVLDGVHFDARIHSPRAIGRKAMNRNLSDCAAMACLPAAAVTTAALPRGCGLDYAQEIYLGMREVADPFDCPIVGGDTGSWNGALALTVTILGRNAGIKPVGRAGAQPGDRVYVSGSLGGSDAGRHMTFTPRVELARTIARSHRVTAMIDLSDGLARDLRNLCQSSGVGADIDADAIPIHDDARDGAARDPRRSALQRAVGDGEDYELLCTSPDDLRPNGLTLIGVIPLGAELRLRRGDGSMEPFPSGGWEHEL